MGGMFTFSLAKQAYYSGSSLQWLEGGRNARAAEAESLEAIRLFRAGGPASRALADELLAHVYLGNSRLTLGEVDGTLEALRPVLDLPPEQRNAWQAKRMRHIAARLAEGTLGRSRLAGTARDEITAFTGTAGRRRPAGPAGNRASLLPRGG
ncbi:MAG TPA: hypothetical protein VMV92_35855 [Streptosporangiaceae bacterium]|nr:hypothetical protein [Streptosporangiaceae bacterium]